MANNSNNINKTKESLNSDGQQFRQHQQNLKQPLILAHRVPKTKRTRHMMLETQVMAWNRHKSMTGLNLLNRFQPPPL
jgi:hypothetical protein